MGNWKSIVSGCSSGRMNSMGLDQPSLEGESSPQGRQADHQQQEDQDKVDDKREDDGDVPKGVPEALQPFHGMTSLHRQPGKPIDW
jgi:hypothetical protein